MFPALPPPGSCSKFPRAAPPQRYRYRGAQEPPNRGNMESWQLLRAPCCEMSRCITGHRMKGKGGRNRRRRLIRCGVYMLCAMCRVPVKSTSWKKSSIENRGPYFLDFLFLLLRCFEVTRTEVALACSCRAAACLASLPEHLPQLLPPCLPSSFITAAAADSRTLLHTFWALPSC